ncbi:hypothetical protein NDU88_006250 [Pleurodeles waltl]|uniref:Uncharacterized protein n=1 Tax=Pleurodeles waltl TaxID=8319 RepID=A0AAV7NYT1_PLEWA|nr:hypothetical protein NDU88_006250 [Pleurodeles waltl]
MSVCTPSKCTSAPDPYLAVGPSYFLCSVLQDPVQTFLRSRAWHPLSPSPGSRWQLVRSRSVILRCPGRQPPRLPLGLHHPPSWALPVQPLTTTVPRVRPPGRACQAQ